MEIGTAHSARPAASAESTAEILLVEDDATDAALTLRALKRCGLEHRVEHVTDGAEALDYIASVSLFAQKHAAPVPRLILLDLGLHKIGGLHVLRPLEADERTKRHPGGGLTSSQQGIERVETLKLC